MAAGIKPMMLKGKTRFLDMPARRGAKPVENESLVNKQSHRRKYFS